MTASWPEKLSSYNFRQAPNIPTRTVFADQVAGGSLRRLQFPSTASPRSSADSSNSNCRTVPQLNTASRRSANSTSRRGTVSRTLSASAVRRRCSASVTLTPTSAGGRRWRTTRGGGGVPGGVRGSPGSHIHWSMPAAGSGRKFVAGIGEYQG